MKQSFSGLKPRTPFQYPLLAFDASWRNVSVVVALGPDQYFNEHVAPVVQSHQGVLVVQNVLALAKIDLKAIQTLVIGHGPGSFTSLRVGFALCLGMFFGRELQVYSVSSLYWRVASWRFLFPEEEILVGMPLGRDFVATAGFLKNNLVTETLVSSQEWLSLCQKNSLAKSWVAQKENVDILIPRVFSEDWLAQHLIRHDSLASVPIQYMLNPGFGL